MSDFSNITAGDVEQSVLDGYITEATMSDLPEGLTIFVGSRQSSLEAASVMIGIVSNQSHDAILEELHTMLPRQTRLTVAGAQIWVAIDPVALAVREVAPPPP